MKSVIEVRFYDGPNSVGADVSRIYYSQLRVCWKNQFTTVCSDGLLSLDKDAEINLTPAGKTILGRLYNVNGVRAINIKEDYMVTVVVFGQGKTRIFDWVRDGIHEHIVEAFQAAASSLGPDVRVVFVDENSGSTQEASSPTALSAEELPSTDAVLTEDEVNFRRAEIHSGGAES
jgi:hypothetical protein